MSTRATDTYELKLTPLSPIHIGTGREYFPQEYCLVSDPDRVLIVDLNSLIQKYPDIAEQSFAAGRREPLWKTPAGNLVRQDKSLVLYSDKTDRHTAGDIKTYAERGNAATIREFTKTANSQPYIPGSSVKGAVRTAIAYALLSSSAEMFTRFKRAVVLTDNGRVRQGDKEAVEHAVFGDSGDAHEDIMRVWSFSDSSSLACDRTLTVVKGKRLSSTGPLGYENYYEVLTETSGPLLLRSAFDRALAASGAWTSKTLSGLPKTMKDVFSCLNQFADDIIAYELTYFDRHPAKPQEVVNFYQTLKQRREHGEVLLCLGKGTGWHRKTIGQLLRKDRSSIFRDVVSAYSLGKGQRRFTDFPTSREMAVRARMPGVFGWARIEQMSSKQPDGRTR